MEGLKIKTFLWSMFVLLLNNGMAHEAKDFDDSILYKIDFELPDLPGQQELGNQIRTFYTHEKEKYECLIPALETPKEEEKANQPELSPIGLLQPIFAAPTCSYRIEAYWSYEICHGHHVRQYHEEREGKNVKFQEYYLGKWSEEKTELLTKAWEVERKGGNKPKYKTLKIDNTRYPYFEMEFSDGTMCDIIDAPRTTLVRYVCYPHGKDDIYSFKETSSCNYEAIILTSVLCVIPAFHAEESKEISIKCFNSETKPHKPLSMLRQELREWQESEHDFLISKESKPPAKLWPKADGDLVTFKYSSDVDKIVLELIANGDIDVENDYHQLLLSRTTLASPPPAPPAPPLNDLSPIKEFISGKNCLTGGTGWWKYEFCYGKHVRQFHKDKNNDVELFLGFFSEAAHRQWVALNPDKGARRPGFTSSIWHHYEKGTHCDRTGLPREVDVKLTCTPVTTSGTAVSMYLLEPKTCQYILVVESPIICDLMHYADDHGLVKAEKLQKFLHTDKPTAPAPGHNTESEEQIRS
ncbi:endoplasmic reticulum lectin 1 [Scaptodrosophila lebanonensis]|uniref:Endoplasmic reticulum lectin 1 n=1 Tax=Drosophila lebanonensis TaxID=7225 RepID=A0A6J2U765_DROLE|nr:endoplasmic reticulum lectin 1 [Scaptodrosophila lebanonensis]